MGRFRDRRKEIKKLPLRDRPGWNKFKQILPGVASGIASLVPGGGVISSVIDSLKRDTDTDPAAVEEALKFLSPVLDEETHIDIADRMHAREADLARQSSQSWLVRNITALLAVIWSLFTVAILTLALTGHVSEKENIVFLVVNTVTNIIMLIVGYYFGSSDSSSKKNDQIERMSKNERGSTYAEPLSTDTVQPDKYND